jgi:hypothetical protein
MADKDRRRGLSKFTAQKGISEVCKVRHRVKDRIRVQGKRRGLQGKRRGLQGKRV